MMFKKALFFSTVSQPGLTVMQAAGAFTPMRRPFAGAGGLKTDRRLRRRMY
jgi:hypothetical protein